MEETTSTLPFLHRDQSPIPLNVSSRPPTIILNHAYPDVLGLGITARLVELAVFCVTDRGLK